MSCLFAYSRVSSQSTRLVGWILTLVAIPIQLHPQAMRGVSRDFDFADSRNKGAQLQ